MPVSFFPLTFPALLIGVPFLFRFKGQKAFQRALTTSALIVMLLFFSVYVPGCVYYLRARCGDPVGMYEMARWTESHDGQIGKFMPWPVIPDTLGGYAWLEKSAAMDYPPAVYAIGVRLKHGMFVPRPPKWSGAEGNSFSQPERGQALIDKAIGLGYRPTIEEIQFYFGQYRS